MKPGLSGYVCVRNATVYDYPISEAVLSLVPVCDEVLISCADSDDDTWEICADLVWLDSRVKLYGYPWDNPHRDIHFWTRWMNFARNQLSYDTQLELDADEVLDPAGYDQIRAMKSTGCSAMFQRLNFWKDAQHLAPHNRVCGEMVARLGPTSLYMPSDEPQPAVHPNVRTNAAPFPSLRIFHYGFLRKPDAFVKKADAINQMFFGSTDPRLAEQVAKGERWDNRDYFSGEPLRPFNEQHPEVARRWLQERGYSLT